MRKEVLDVLVDLVFEDVMQDGQLFEANPYHDAQGRFTSKDAAAAYGMGAMAAGRGAGMIAKAEGKSREDIRAAIKRGIEAHVATSSLASRETDRFLGQKKLGVGRADAAAKATATTNAIPLKDAAYVNALLKPETDAWKSTAKAGNIERVLERHAAGQARLAPETIAALKAAHAAHTKVAEAAKPKR